MDALIDRLQREDLDGLIMVPGSNLLRYTGVKVKQSERLILFFIDRTGKTVVLTPQVERDKFSSIDINHLISYKDEEGPQSGLRTAEKLLPSWVKGGIEYGNCRVREFKYMNEICGTLVDADPMLAELSMIKNEDEADRLGKSVDVLEDSLSAALPYIKSGVREVEVAARLEYEMRKRGSTGTPFETIVASGTRGVSPHGRASDKVIQEGELVILDVGSIVDGYVGDISRTVSIGPPSEEQRHVYDVVREAQHYAISKIRPGVTAHDIDEAARSVIEHHGYGESFNHRTGHGIGLNAHEEPYIMQNNNLVLESGMTFTVEPGIYLQGKFGVRIEDNIHVTTEGALNFMTLGKELLTL